MGGVCLLALKADPAGHLLVATDIGLMNHGALFKHVTLGHTSHQQYTIRGDVHNIAALWKRK